MKFLYFYQYFTTPKGSWSTIVYENARRWIQEGHEVIVVTAPYEKSDIQAKGFISTQQIEGIKLIVINLPDSNRSTILRRAFNAFIFSLWSTYYTITYKYDVALASSGPITIGIPMIFAKMLRSKKTVFEVRDLWPAGIIFFFI